MWLIRLSQLHSQKSHLTQPKDSGNVTLLVALMMVVLCGFGAVVLDVGSLFVQKQNLQAGADAGALAGADELLAGASPAANAAYQICSANDTAGTYSVAADVASESVTVTANQPVPLWFAKIWGDTQTTVHATAKAQLGTLTSAVGIVPIAVVNQTFVYGQEYTLSDGAGNGQQGNYGFLDLSGNGANGVETDIENGYTFALHVGEQVPTKPGVMSGPVSTAIDYRMNEAADNPNWNNFSTVTSDSPRILYLPVVDTLDVNGKKDVTILGFAAFFLDGLSGNGGNQEILGRFLQIVRPGQIGSGTNYGTYSVHLTN